jgi:hypothetical protein
MKALNLISLGVIAAGSLALRTTTASAEQATYGHCANDQAEGQNKHYFLDGPSGGTECRVCGSEGCHLGYVYGTFCDVHDPCPA